MNNNNNNDPTAGALVEATRSAHFQPATTVLVGVENGHVEMRFAAPIESIAFPPAQAIEIAASLIKHARRTGCKEPLVYRIGGHTRIGGHSHE